MRRRAAADMKGGLILIGGEAGIGKSRLIAEFVKVTRTRRTIAECREFAQNPLGPLDEILNDLDEGAVWPRTFESPEARLAETLASFARIAARRATIVIIEDLQWADPELISVLRTLAARAASQRLVFVASYRDDEIGPHHPNFVAFGRLVREAATSVVTLERMNANALGELVRSALEDDGTAQPLSSLVIDDVVRRSDGNPLFAEELSRHALDRRGATTPGDLESVPLTLHAIVRERLLSCGERERRLLFAAALCGRRFDLDILDDVFAERETPEERSASLRRLGELQFIDPIEGQPRSFAFRHALTRDALYAELLPSDAGPLHRKIAIALAHRPDAPARAIEIAYHYWQSGERALAAEPCEAAGKAASDALAYGEAIRWYERAIEAYGSAEERVARATLELGKICVLAEEKERALAAYEDVVRYALRRNDTVLLVRARKLMSGTLVNDGRIEAALALIEETLARIRAPDDRRLRDDLHLRAALYLIEQQDADRLLRALEDVDPERLDAGSPARAEYHHARAYLAARSHDVAEWDAQHERARDVYRSIHADPFVHWSYGKQAWQAIGLGDLRLAETLLEGATKASEMSASTVNDVPLTLALMHFYAGRFDDARASLDRAIPSPLLSCRWLATFLEVELALALGDDVTLQTKLDLPFVTELARRETFGFVRVCTSYAAGLERLGRHAEASALLARTAPHIRSTLDFVPSILAIAEMAPEVAAPLRPLLADAATNDDFSAAALALVDAELALRAGAADACEREALVAYAAFDRLGWPMFAARAAELAGRNDDALAIFQRIGHVAGIRRFANLSGGPQTGGTRVDVLTSRERKLAELIAAGKTNRESAELMFLSEKTVEKYLTSIYAKLSIASRVQLARLVAAGDAMHS